MSENIIYKKIKPNIGLLTINREKALNTLSLETVTELKEFIDNQLPKEEIRVLIITGSGKKAFVAGADISQMKEMNKDEFKNYCEISHGNFNNLQKLIIPVIAAINGYALGGGSELALACDIRIASDNAKLGFPETKLGLFPCWGGSQRALRLLGIAKAKELIFTGEMISAEQAAEIGMVDKVVKQDDLMDEVVSIAEKISGNSPLAVGYAKEMINSGQDLVLSESLELELQKGIECFDSYDRQEGMSAFIEKRTAEFKGT
ncbi:MAG TPA: enoyl-CoA hydratase-related protein [Thermodesulfobacteriota bacterium]|nr:enoyl-CoA hydratase-related protein [Thermodesulfobacteriota bacterium]